MIRFTQSLAVALGITVVTLGFQAKHWAYEDHGDEVGPAKWGTLPGDATCGSGKQQAPIIRGLRVPTSVVVRRSSQIAHRRDARSSARYRAPHLARPSL